MAETQKSGVLLNAEADPNYRPYCLNCSTMRRMVEVKRFHWQCPSCGAQHDETPNLASPRDPSREKNAND